MASLSNQDPKSERSEILAKNRYQDILAWDYARRSLGPGRYSLRAYARHLGVSPSTLSEVLNGKAQLSPARAAKIVERMELEPLASHYFRLLVDAQTRKHKQKREEALLEAKAIRQSYMYDRREPHPLLQLDWTLVHYGLLLLARLQQPIEDEVRFAQLLGCRPDELCHARDDLVSSGWLSLEKSVYTAKPTYILTEAKRSSPPVRVFHRLMLENAQRTLEAIPVEKRFFFGTLFTLSSSHYQRLTEKIQKIALEISDDLNDVQTQDTIYALSFQLCPLLQESSCNAIPRPVQ